MAAKVADGDRVRRGIFLGLVWGWCVGETVVYIAFARQDGLLQEMLVVGNGGVFAAASVILFSGSQSPVRTGSYKMCLILVVVRVFRAYH